MGLWLPNQKPPRGAIINPSHPIARGLVAAWLLNEMGGGTIFDSVIRDKSVSDGSWSAGGAYFNGSQRVITRDVDEPSSAITVAARFWVDANLGESTKEGGIVNKPYSGSEPWVSYALTATSSNLAWVPTFYLGTTEGLQSAGVSGGVTNYAWFTVCGAWSVGSPVRLYINGRLASSSANHSGTILHSTTYDQCIGFNDLDNKFFKGFISFVYIWARELSSHECARLSADPYAMFQRRVPVRYFYLPTGGETLLINVHDCGSDRPVIFD